MYGDFSERKEGSCEPLRLISGDEVKYLRIDMLRDVSSEKMAEVLTPIPGKAFAMVLWSCYFSNKTCCADLKAQILSHCRK